MGGVAKVILDLVPNIDLLRFELTIIVLSKNIELLNQYTLPDSIKVLSFAYEYDEDYSLRKHILFSFFNSLTLIRAKEILIAIKNLKPDIIHFHTLPRELTIGILAQKENSCAIVYTDHLVRIKPTEYTFIIRFLLGRTFKRLYTNFHLIAVSKSVEAVVKKYKLLGNNKKYMLLENQIDPVKFSPDISQKTTETINVIYIARICLIKGQQDLINAWSKLKTNKPKKLLLVGPDEMSGKIQEYASRIIKDNSVEFLGSQNDILPFLKKANIAVFPSYKEGLPLSLLEKMAMELPIAASDIDEIKSIITHTKNGLLFKCGNAEDLAEKLNLLIENKNLRDSLGKEARVTILEKYGQGNTASIHEQFYFDILNS